MNLPYPVTYLLNLAVPCFFVVSGYLIIASAIKNDFRTFFKKRFARIYPAYFACICLIVVFFAPLAFILSNGGTISLYEYINQNPSPIKFFIYNLPLILIQTSIGNTLTLIPFDNWNGSAWTLIFEFGCYVAIAVTVKLLSKLKIKEEKFFSLILGMHILLIFISLFYPRYPYKFSYFINAIYLFSIFLGGSTLYLIKDKLKFSFRIVFLFLIFCIIIMTFVPSYWAIEICSIPMAYIILFISVTLKSPKFIKENDISYGMYIYAWPIQCVILSFIIVFEIPIDIWLYNYLLGSNCSFCNT